MLDALFVLGFISRPELVLSVPDFFILYISGNTNVLSVLKTGILATISRRLQVSLTYIWGKWGLPVPRDCKLLYVSGQPLGLPKIDNPTQEDIDKYHKLYCDQVTRLFEKYKEKVSFCFLFAAFGGETKVFSTTN